MTTITQKYPVTIASAVNTEEGLTVQAVVKELIVAPTFTSPSAKASTSASNEVGSSVAIKATFTPGNSGGINTGGTFGNVSIGSTTYSKLSISNNVITYSPTYKVPLGSTTITYGAIPYNAGTGEKKYKINNKEVDLTMPNPIVAGSVTPNPSSQTIYGYLKIFIAFTLSVVEGPMNLSEVYPTGETENLSGSSGWRTCNTTPMYVSENTKGGTWVYDKGDGVYYGIGSDSDFKIHPSYNSILVAVPSNKEISLAAYQETGTKEVNFDPVFITTVNIKDAGDTEYVYNVYKIISNKLTISPKSAIITFTLTTKTT